MAAGQRPKIKCDIKAKEGQSKARGLLAAWVREDGSGLSGTFDREVVAIKFADGTVLRVGDCWCNVYDNDTPRAPKPLPDAAKVDSDDIPF